VLTLGASAAERQPIAPKTLLEQGLSFYYVSLSLFCGIITSPSRDNRPRGLASLLGC
jgi:hypothetical protein